MDDNRARNPWSPEALARRNQLAAEAIAAGVKPFDVEAICAQERERIAAAIDAYRIAEATTSLVDGALRAAADIARGQARD